MIVNILSYIVLINAIFAKGHTIMLVLDEDRLSQFLRNVSEGLAKSPLEVALALLFIILFFATLVFIYLLQKKKQHQRLIANAKLKLKKYVEKYKLNPSELALIDRLAKYLKNPEIEKPLLLSNQVTFNYAASKLLTDEGIPESTLAALRIKLGFATKDNESPIHSTGELSPGITFYIIQGGIRKFYGKLKQITPQSLIVQIDKKTIPPGTGSSLKVFFQRKNGIFAFNSYVQKLEGNFIHIAHSEKIKTSQKRRYYRRKLSAPVLIRVAGSEEKPVKTIFVDLGGGGASVINPNKRFKLKDDVELIFYVSREERVSVIGEVIRVSKNGDIIHLAFGPIRDSTRDKIIGYVLKGNIQKPQRPPLTVSQQKANK